MHVLPDLMQLKRIHNTKKKGGGKKTERKTESVLSALTPGLCFDFHPAVSLCSSALGLYFCVTACTGVLTLLSHMSLLLQDSSLYLVGTGEGLIHKCSCSNTQQFLETYRKHFVSLSTEKSALSSEGWFKDLSSLLIILHWPLHTLSSYAVITFSADVTRLFGRYRCRFTFMNRPVYWLLSQFIREDTGRQGTRGREVQCSDVGRISWWSTEPNNKNMSVR